MVKRTGVRIFRPSTSLCVEGAVTEVSAWEWGGVWKVAARARVSAAARGVRRAWLFAGSPRGPCPPLPAREQLLAEELSSGELREVGLRVLSGCPHAIAQGSQHPSSGSSGSGSRRPPGSSAPPRVQRGGGGSGGSWRGHGCECVTSEGPIPGLPHPSPVAPGRPHPLPQTLLCFSTKQSSQLHCLTGWGETQATVRMHAQCGPRHTVGLRKGLKWRSREAGSQVKRGSRAVPGEQAQAAGSAADSVLQGLWPRRRRASGLL